MSMEKNSNCNVFRLFFFGNDTQFSVRCIHRILGEMCLPRLLSSHGFLSSTDIRRKLFCQDALMLPPCQGLAVCLLSRSFNLRNGPSSSPPPATPSFTIALRSARRLSTSP